MTKLAQSVLIIYTSPNMRDPWTQIEPAAVPEWLKHPDIMSRMASGAAVMDPRSVSGSDWFRAVHCLTPEARRLVKDLDAVNARRARQGLH